MKTIIKIEVLNESEDPFQWAMVFCKLCLFLYMNVCKNPRHCDLCNNQCTSLFEGPFMLVSHCKKPWTSLCLYLEGD